MVAMCLALAAAPAALAQSQGTGQIVGTVYDASGAAIPGAKVTATGKATGLVRELETNEAGQYRFVLLPPGPYTVSVKHTGFKNAKSDVNVSVGSAVTADFRMQLGEVTEVVEVTATVAIETTAVQTDALINERSISELPINGRRFQDFVTLTPTVQIEPSRNGISFAGQRGINANITIDGADYNQPFFGGIRGGERSNQSFSIPQEAIKEFQIVSYGFSAEFGRSSSGVMNAVTKSGTNDWHASAFWYIRHKDMAHRDAFNRTSLDTQHQFGGSVGGPVRRDKSFAFAAYEQQRLRLPRTVIFRALDTGTAFAGRTAANGEAFDFYRSLEGPYTETNDAWTVLARWDEQLTTNHRVAVRYHWGKNKALNAVATGAPTVPETNNALSNNGTEGDEHHTVATNWTGILSPRIVNEFRFQYSRERRPRTANALQTGVGNTIGNYGTRSFLPTTQKDYRVQVSNGLSWNIGRHSIRVGGDFNHLFADQFFAFNQRGIFSISGSGVDTVLNIMALDPANPNDRRFDSTAVSYGVAIGNGLADMDMQELAFYFQDSWRITPRFTLNFGVRWEGYFNPQPEANNAALVAAVQNFAFPNGRRVDPTVIHNNLDQWAPRVGIAWDPWGNGRTVFRANGGIYYARNPLLLFAGPLNNFRTPPGDVRSFLPLSVSTLAACPAVPVGYPGTAVTTGPVTSQWCSTVYGQMFLAGVNLNTLSLDQLPRLTQAQIQTIATGLGLPFNPNQGLSVITWANDYESPRSWQWNMSLQHELIRGLTVGGDFVYINTVHLQRNREYNLPSPFINPADLSLRPCFNLRTVTGGCMSTTPAPAAQTRPITSLSSMQVRESNSRALYRGFTWRATYHRSRYQFQAYYTYSFNYSDDDNERDAGGQSAVNAFNLQDEYGFSRIDARHNFMFNTVWDLPYGFTVGALSRLRSGRPVDPVTGSDSNGDFITNDRAFLRPGVPMRRNSFRDRSIRNVDLRVGKKFDLPREGMHINLTVDFFNIFNFDNVTYSGGTRTYGTAGITTAGAVTSPSSSFLQLIDPALCLANNPTRGNKSCFDTRNTPGFPFQMQVGVRFQF
jgi:outer membrane receptor for ferrienterochelin and colicin